MHPPADIPQPYHRWRANEDMYFRSDTPGSYSGPDYCVACGIIRYPLNARAQKVAEGSCTGSHAGAAAALDAVTL